MRRREFVAGLAGAAALGSCAALNTLINAGTARALGPELPVTLVALASEVIE